MNKKFFLLFSIFALNIFSSTVLAFPFRKYPQTKIDYYFLFPYYILLFLNFLFILFLLKIKNKDLPVKKPLLFLIIQLVFSRIIFLSSRLIMGPLEIDGDITNFYNQAKSFATDTLPFFEYPPLTLYYFALVYKIAGGIFLHFCIIFALLNLFFETVFVGLIYKFSKIYKKQVFVFWAVLFYIVSGFFTHFLYAKFDVLVMLLMVLSLFFFWKRKITLSLILANIGFSFKWFPLIIFPFIYLYLIKKRKFGLLIVNIILSITIQILISYPIAKRGLSNIIFPYIYQGSREALAESIYFGPDLLMRGGRIFDFVKTPWDTLKNSFWGIKKTSLIQFVAVLSVAGLALVKKKNVKNLTTLCLLTLIVFIIFNRIFSSQFYYYLFFSYLLLYVFGKRNVKEFFFFQFILSALNFTIWPAFLSFWPISVIIFFVVNLMVSAKFLMSVLRFDPK